MKVLDLQLPDKDYIPGPVGTRSDMNKPFAFEADRGHVITKCSPATIVAIRLV